MIYLDNAGVASTSKLPTARGLVSIAIRKKPRVTSRIFDPTKINTEPSVGRIDVLRMNSFDIDSASVLSAINNDISDVSMAGE